MGILGSVNRKGKFYAIIIQRYEHKVMNCYILQVYTSGSVKYRLVMDSCCYKTIVE